MNEKVEETIERIEYYDGKFPKEDLLFLLDNQTEVTPYLLAAISNPQEVLHKLSDEVDYILPFYAFFMLAQFRETRAYQPIYEIFSSDKDVVDELFGELITEDLGRILASVYDGDVSLINRLIEGEEVYEYVRSAALDSWLCLLQANLKAREEVIAYYKTLFEIPCEEESFLRGSLIGNCLDLKAVELLPEIEKSYAENKVELMLMGDWDDFREQWAKEKSEFLDGTNKHYDLVTDTISEMEWWAYFQEPKEVSNQDFWRNQPDQNSPNYQVIWDSNMDGTFARETPKVGKNELCPCGSGRKYKKCCLN